MCIYFYRVATWLSTDGFAVWLPNQSGFRYLMLPVGVCLAFAITAIRSFAAGAVAGAGSGLALVYNLETGVGVTAALGMAWLLRTRHKFARQWFTSAMAGLVSISAVFLLLAAVHRYYFGYWPLPMNTDLSVNLLAAVNQGYGGLPLQFRPLPILIMAHAGYQFVCGVHAVLDRRVAEPIP